MDKHDLHAELLRALEAVEKLEKIAPAGIQTQWAQLAKRRIENAIEILGVK